jgi:diguanylate cyclase (GGDEF)-like protein
VSSVASVGRLPSERLRLVGLPTQARRYLFSTLGLAAAAALVASWAHPGHVPWADFAVLLAGGALAQLFAVHMPANQIFHTGIAFTVAAALLLPPEAFLIICIAQHIPEWLRQRHPWYIQSFNIANCMISGLGVWATRDAAARLGVHVGIGTVGVVAAVCAGGLFVLLNHVLLARMLRLARGHELKATRLFMADGLLTDLVLAAIGIGTAIALVQEPAAAAVTALPLIMIHRALAVPSLRAQALRDHKTGLLNSRGIAEAGQSELERATRFVRPLSLLVVDVDDLREINNNHGHLAGDAALVALADAFRTELRDFDLCARFGGDEFLVLLPETPLAEALAVAGRIEERVGGCRLPTAGEPVSFGVSIGAAERHPQDATVEALVQRADAAMYEAKYAGNRAADG